MDKILKQEILKAKNTLKLGSLREIYGGIAFCIIIFHKFDSWLSIEENVTCVF